MTSSDAELPRNAIFLSYASEDVVLMRWLAGKLATAGYAVWCDQWRLFGGLDWPSEIDVAIKQHTARMVALVSQHSLRKPNPQREWTLGLTLEQERKEKGFLIPLNVDGQPSSAFPWQLAGRQYVACQRWDEGLDGLLRALEEYRVPRPLTNQGASLSLLPLEPMQVLREEPEELVTNRFAILDIPAVLKRYRPARSFTRAELEFIRATWPTREGGDGYLYAFGDPPDNLLPAPVSPAGALVWTDGKAIGERPAAHLVKPILRDAVTAHGLARGLERWPEVKGLRFPEGLVLENTIFFRHPSGRPGKCRMVGDRLPGKPRAFRYHIGFVPFIQHTGNTAL